MLFLVYNLKQKKIDLKWCAAPYVLLSYSPTPFPKSHAERERPPQIFFFPLKKKKAAFLGPIGPKILVKSTGIKRFKPHNWSI